MPQDLERSPKQVIVDLGYCGVDADNPGVQIIHRGKYKSLSDHEKRLLKRRQAIEPLIGHTKADHRMDRCWLQGAVGDALHALCCAAGRTTPPRKGDRLFTTHTSPSTCSEAVGRLAQVLHVSHLRSCRPWPTAVGQNRPLVTCSEFPVLAHFG